MTVDDLIAKIATMMPGPSTTPEAMARWAPVYYRVLKDHEGRKLEAGWDKLLEGWTFSRAPRPAEILEIVENTRPSRSGRLYGDLSDDELERRTRYWREKFERSQFGEHGLRKLEDEAAHRNLLL